MKEFLEKLRQQVAENPPNYGDADSVLGLPLSRAKQRAQWMCQSRKENMS